MTEAHVAATRQFRVAAARARWSALALAVAVAASTAFAGVGAQRSRLSSFGRAPVPQRRNPSGAASYGDDAGSYGPPEPYDFSYSSQDAEGTHSRSEQSDANGRVTGEYSLQLADGRTRLVKYYADDTGFHADVDTNELGTESKNPADVTIRSSAITGAEAALQGPARSGSSGPVAGRAPLAASGHGQSAPQRLPQRVGQRGRRPSFRGR